MLILGREFGPPSSLMSTLKLPFWAQIFRLLNQTLFPQIARSKSTMSSPIGPSTTPLTLFTFTFSPRECVTGPNSFARPSNILNLVGWLEIQEFAFGYPLASSTINQSPATTAWANTVLNAAAKVGIDLTAAANFGPLLEAAGFSDWKAQKRIWPIGPWSDSQKEKTLGIWARQDLEDALGAVSLAFLTRIEGWTKEEVEVTLATVRKEIRDLDVHQYTQL
jgi:hypothetical protein